MIGNEEPIKRYGNSDSLKRFFRLEPSIDRSLDSF